jgi:hypothetical protein
MPSIKLLKRAEIELFDSCEWYEKQQKGLSMYFRNEIGKTFQTINTNPFLYNSRYNTDLRFAPLNKFPFIIVYWFDQNLDTVFIASIFHTKRNPEGFA